MTSIRNFDIGGAPARKETRRSSKPQQSDEPITDFYPSSRARENFLPNTDELARMISRALTALSRGVFWDRGSIVNIVV